MSSNSQQLSRSPAAANGDEDAVASGPAAKKPKREPAAQAAAAAAVGYDDDDNVKPDSIVTSSSSAAVKPDPVPATTSSWSLVISGGGSVKTEPGGAKEEGDAKSTAKNETGVAEQEEDTKPAAMAHQNNNRVKKEPDAEEEEEQEDTKPAARHGNNKKKTERILVEFKFRSYKTQLFKEGGLKGTLHIEMDQDADSGVYSIPVGNKTPFQAHLDHDMKKTESWCLGKEEEECRGFSGTFTRTSSLKNGPIDMDPGLVLDFFTGNHRNFKATVRPPSARKHYPDYNELKVQGSVPFVGRGLRDWEKGQGGFLELLASVSTKWTNDVRWGWYGGTYPESRAADGTYKIKLYTVLSAHRPSSGEEEEDSLPTYSSGQCPNWDALVRVVAARNPDKRDDDGGGDSWARRAVRQYRYFMDLKVDPKLAKQKFSPSCAIDDIWHAHLSFPERYQHDLVCLTKGKGIVEHMPVHMKQSAKYYEKAHAQHSKRMAKLGLCVDKEFWPEPTPYDPSQHENASDDEKMTGRLVDGKPRYRGGSSGCGGCG